jgi:hypothetical protein
LACAQALTASSIPANLSRLTGDVDPFVLTIAGKLVLMGLLILGGLYQINRGYRLYQDGRGTNPEKTTIEFWKFKANTTSTGAMIMATASVWAVCAVYINPGVQKEADKWRVSYFSVPGAEVKSPTLSVAAMKTTPELDADRVKELFAKAAEGTKGIDKLTINGKQAVIDLDALSTLKSESGTVLVTLPIHSDNQSALVAYLPEVKDQQLLFIPAGVASFKGMKIRFYDEDKSESGKNKK